MLDIDFCQNEHADKRLSAVFPNFDGTSDLVLSIEPVPDHFDREISRFRFGFLRTAAHLSVFVVDAGAAFLNIKMISWHRFKTPSRCLAVPGQTILAVLTREP